MPTPEVLKAWKVLGFGKHPEIGAAVQARLREAGLAARTLSSATPVAHCPR